MRRIYVLPLILLLSLTVVVAMAQEDPPPDTPTPVPTVFPDEPIDDPVDDPANSNYFMNLNNGPLTINAGEGSDYCDTATLIASAPAGNQMNVANMSWSITDPDLSCIWGTPQDNNYKGYRTVWYQFEPDFNGIMRVSTQPASTQGTTAYDTVLAVHANVSDELDDCSNLTTFACNDDKVGFSSEVMMNIRRDTTYYIEVADWQAGGNLVKTLDLFVEIVPFTSMWKPVNTGAFTYTSRHASVVRATNIYFLGGRNGAGNLLNNVQKLNTITGTWVQVNPPIPGGGFLNTTAVYLSDTDSIYLPGGSIQTNDQAYSREHKYIEMINANSGVWYTASEEVGGDSVTEAFAYAAAAPNNANDGYFLTGGIVGPSLLVTSTVSNQVLFYQPDDDTWIEREAMGSPRYGHVAANVNGKLCVAGGLNTDGVSNILIPNGECASGVSPSAWSPTANNMQVPRYFAHSSVGPDGKWYVYGGIDGTGAAVPEVEYYDPETNRWVLLGLSYDLWGQSGKPAVVWPGGGFVGNYLWAAGGSYDSAGASPNPLVAKVQLLGGSLYLPIILNGSNSNNHSFADALTVPLGKTVSQNFTSVPLQNYNVYKFSFNNVSTIQAALTSVASTANLNLYIYGENKDLVQSNTLPFVGIDKTISVPLAPGTYYVVVKYNSSTNYPNDISDYYQLRISKQ